MAHSQPILTSAFFFAHSIAILTFLQAGPHIYSLAACAMVSDRNLTDMKPLGWGRPTECEVTVRLIFVDNCGDNCRPGAGHCGDGDRSLQARGTGRAVSTHQVHSQGAADHVPRIQTGSLLQLTCSFVHFSTINEVIATIMTFL